MPRPATGSPRYSVTQKCWIARVTVPGTERRVPVRISGLGPHEKERAIVEAKKRSDLVRDGGFVPVEMTETVSEWSTRWLADRTTRKLNAKDNQAHLECHVLDVVGTLPIASVKRSDVERVVESLDAKVRAGTISWKTAVNAWSTTSKMFDDASNSKTLALRVDGLENPAKGVRGPDRGDKRSKQYLYPSEFLRFVSCEDVPMVWRRMVAIAVYTYMRDGELRALDGADVDTEHGIIHVHRAYNRRSRKVESTKSGVARRVPIERMLSPILAGVSRGLVLAMPSERTMARGLRRWLKRAGVDRRALHDATKTSKPITFHDLRATGITWMAIRGDEPMKIMQRAGHTDIETTLGYVREAESLREGFGDVFPVLPELGRSGPGQNQSEVSMQNETAKSGADGTRTPLKWPFDVEPDCFGLPEKTAAAGPVHRALDVLRSVQFGRGEPERVAALCQLAGETLLALAAELTPTQRATGSGTT